MAQLDRASPSEGGDCAFESRRVRQNKAPRQWGFFLCRNPRFGRARVRQQVVENKQRAVQNVTVDTQAIYCRVNPPGAPK